MRRRQLDTLQTPEWVLNEIGPFDLDPCAGENTTHGKVNWWIGRGENGLEREWRGHWFCNPPFSEKDVWIAKCIEYSPQQGILLLPERGSAPWFGPLAIEATALFVMGKKINFIGGPSSNNLGTVLFLFGEEMLDRLNSCHLPGTLLFPHRYRNRNGFSILH